MFLQLLRAIQKGELHLLISNINRSGNLPYRLPIHFFSNIWIRERKLFDGEIPAFFWDKIDNPPFTSKIP